MSLNTCFVEDTCTCPCPHVDTDLMSSHCAPCRNTGRIETACDVTNDLNYCFDSTFADWKRVWSSGHKTAIRIAASTSITCSTTDSVGDEVTNRYVENLREQEAALLGATVPHTLRGPTTGAPSTSIAKCYELAAWWQRGLRSCPPPARVLGCISKVGAMICCTLRGRTLSCKAGPTASFIVKHLDERSNKSERHHSFVGGQVDVA